jgi:PleD family two-component response regulator
LEKKTFEGLQNTFTSDYFGDTDCPYMVYTIKDDDYNKYRVLIVEDDPLSSQILELALMKKRLSVEVVTDGFSAVDLFEKNFFDRVFMDVNLPDINGYEVTQKIKAIN